MLSSELLDDYLERSATSEHPYLHALYRSTQIELLRPRMASGHLQGLFLKMLVEMMRAKLVLEIGTYSGYSALSMASGMSEGGRVVSFEINDEQEDFTKPWLEKSPFKGKVEMVIGDIFKMLPLSSEMFDMAFIDADKREYSAYYDLIFSRIRKGGLIIADNTLWDNHVVDPSYNKDPQTLAIRAFNEKVAHDKRVESIILPIRDGLTLIRKK